jgi:putative ABC transport system substrate-binding protein
MSGTAMKSGVRNVLLLLVVLVASSALLGDSFAQVGAARVGILSFAAVKDDPNLQAVLPVFQQALASRGWIEGKNVTFVYRDASREPARFSAAAVELSTANVDVIFATSAPALRAAHAATKTIPIVAGDFTTDPVADGYIESFGRPGGNVTGIFLDAPEFAGKWFEILQAMVPELSRVSVLWDPGPGTTHLKAVRSVAASLSIKLQVLEVKKPADLDDAFSALSGRPQALILLPSPMIYNQSARLARLAAKHDLLAVSMAREFAEAGGMLAYGPERASAWERGGVFVARILEGTSPAVLPVEQPIKIQLVVNMKTAKALGVTVPESIFLRADEVLE